VSSKNPSSIFLAIGAVIVIIFAIVITALAQGPPEKSFSQIITVGPVWNTNTWSCTSDADFMVYGTLRSLQGATLTISISGLGTQSLYSLNAGQIETFSVGSPASHTMTITGTGATVTGWITLQTTSGATASCTQI